MRLAFLLNFPEAYKGGINYYKNLFFALNSYHSDTVLIYLFVPSNTSAEVESIFKEYAIVKRTSILQRKTIPWLISVLSNKFLKFDFLTYRLFRTNKIDVVSYNTSFYYVRKIVKTINWIPDFQSLHYPQFWTKKQLRIERKILQICLNNSECIVLSSYSALEDLLSIFPDSKSKTEVVHFVSQPSILAKNNSLQVSKYSGAPFFFMPNQFWEHKNHIIVFKAVQYLKSKGVEVLVLCSGLMHDYRGRSRHVEELILFIQQNELSENIKLLGLLPYEDVFGLFHNSIAVINPSYFEGWSSTVEEAKCINKIVILSNIPVHREQAPDHGIYFNPDDEKELADIMLKVLLQGGETVDDTNASRVKLLARTKEFADRYKSVLDKVYSNEDIVRNFNS